MILKTVIRRNSSSYDNYQFFNFFVLKLWGIFLSKSEGPISKDHPMLLSYYTDTFVFV